MSELKNILVTGASKGIGKGVAICLGNNPEYKVFVHYHSDEKGALETVDEIRKKGSQAQAIQFDVRDRNESKKVLESIMKDQGAFYGIVSNAGITRDEAFPGMLDENWDDVIRTNLDGFYNVIRPCVMGMIKGRRGGRIVAMSSVSGITGNRGQVNYSASKAGIIGAVKALAVELAKRGITVNCVAPGLIDTGMIDDEIWEHAKPIIPMQRMGTVEEVGSLVKYLISDESSYITRQVISVNGGMV